MSAFQGAVNTTINGGIFTAVSNTGGNLSASNDIVALLLSHSATAGLLDAKERFDAPKCDEGTRVSMLREMTKFVQQGGHPSVYWLHGPAGIGKSALAQSLALSLKDQDDHAASFFFSRTAPGRNDGNQLIVTLACQLALNIPTIKPLIARVVKENPLILNATNAVKMQNLIVDPINQLYKMSLWSPWLWAQRLSGQKLYPRLILVDGLDECNDPQVQRDLIICIGHAVRQLSLPFQFVITSRPESHILATFELDPIFQGPRGVRLSTKNLGDDKDADSQITTFLLKEFAEIRRTHPIREFLPQPWPAPGQIAQLVSKSSKGFIYPATVIRYIKMPNTRPDECLERILGLSEIPVRDKPYEPLDTLYQYIFESVPDANKEAVRNIFHFLVVRTKSDDFITPRVIEQYFDYKPGHVQHVLRDLLCVASVPAIDRPIKVLHASLPDFLLDRSRSGPLCIDIGDVHATIAASFPLALSGFDTFRLPDFRFAGFLAHMMQSNTLVYHRLLDVDFRSRYMNTYDACLSYNDGIADRTPLQSEAESERLAFVTAYLLVLVIKNAQQIDIRKHIAEIEADICRKHQFSASLDKVRNEFFPAMIPLFRKWALSTIDHQYIKHLFATEVPPSQFEIREEIFQLYLLMTTSFWAPVPGQNNRYSPHTPPVTNYSNYISLILLRFSLRKPDSNLSMERQMLLSADLLGVSLPHAGYSTFLMSALNIFHSVNASADIGEARMQRLAPSVIDYLKRVYSEAPARSQQEILELNNFWKPYLNQQNI